MAITINIFKISLEPICRYSIYIYISLICIICGHLSKMEINVCRFKN